MDIADKTTIDRSIYPQGASASKVMSNLVGILTANSWTVAGSCYYDGAVWHYGTGEITGWDTYSNINTDVDGTNIPWIVLENLDGVQVCIAFKEVNYASASDSDIMVGFSIGGNFDIVSASETAVPVATDEAWLEKSTSTISIHFMENGDANNFTELIWADDYSFFLTAKNATNVTGGFLGFVKLDKTSPADDSGYHLFSSQYHDINDGSNDFTPTEEAQWNHIQVVPTGSIFMDTYARWAFPKRIYYGTGDTYMIEQYPVKDADGNDPEWEVQSITGGTDIGWIRRGTIPDIRMVAGSGAGIAEGTQSADGSRIVIGGFTLPWDGSSWT